jgi:hypothetical protein
VLYLNISVVTQYSKCLTCEGYGSVVGVRIQLHLNFVLELKIRNPKCMHCEVIF